MYVHCVTPYCMSDVTDETGGFKKVEFGVHRNIPAKKVCLT